MPLMVLFIRFFTPKTMFEVILLINFYKTIFQDVSRSFNTPPPAPVRRFLAMNLYAFHGPKSPPEWMEHHPDITCAIRLLGADRLPRILFFIITLFITPFFPTVFMVTLFPQPLRSTVSPIFISQPPYDANHHREFRIVFRRYNHHHPGRFEPSPILRPQGFSAAAAGVPRLCLCAFFLREKVWRLCRYHSKK